MKKEYFVHKYLLLQLIISMLIISIALCLIMIHFYSSNNFEGALYMLAFLILTISIFTCIIFVPITRLISRVEIDSDKIRIKNYSKSIAELFWNEKLTMTEKLIGGAKYLVITGQNNKTILFCYSKSVIKHIMMVCSNKHILDQINKKYKILNQ
ncbi:hypothetical protein [Haploplasma modicum]|uniref:hypothetical protein n=1 Tax=Haploplasma modicum TaxID=2150 RepID=UPI00047D430B|nr:hypothetical protein [Haploplasma modicum]